MIEENINSSLFSNADNLELDLDISTEIYFSRKDHPEGRMVPISIDGKEEYILIPLDVKDGTIIKAKGRGKHNSRLGKTGDLYVRIHIEEKIDFWKKNLIRNKNVEYIREKQKYYRCEDEYETQEEEEIQECEDFAGKRKRFIIIGAIVIVVTLLLGWLIGVQAAKLVVGWLVTGHTVDAEAVIETTDEFLEVNVEQSKEKIGITSMEEEHLTEPSEILDSIKELKFTNKRDFFKGEVLNEETLGLVAVYGSGNEEPIQAGATITPAVLNEVGTERITISYGGITESLDVEVIEVIVQDLAFSDNTSYQRGSVNWVLTARLGYTGNCPNSYGINETLDIDSGPVDNLWEAAKNGTAMAMKGDVFEDKGVSTYVIPVTYILPDDPTFGGNHSISFSVGSVKKTVFFTLIYEGNYTTGSGWEISSIYWH